MNRSTAAAAGLAATLAAVTLFVWLAQRKLIYLPFGEAADPESVGLTGVASATLETEFTVIVFNGNAGNRAMRAPLAGMLRQHGIATLLFDYRGYGGNPGVPTERGLIADARAARRYVASRRDVDQLKVAYFGESLGTAVAVELAAELPPGRLILRSPFGSLAEVGQVHYPFLPVRWLLRDRFASSEFIGRIHVPLLVIAGDRDRIIPLAHSRRLFAAGNDPKRFVVIRNADHNDAALLDGEEMIASIVQFLRGG